MCVCVCLCASAWREGRWRRMVTKGACGVRMAPEAAHFGMISEEWNATEATNVGWNVNHVSLPHQCRTCKMNADGVDEARRLVGSKAQRTVSVPTTPTTTSNSNSVAPSTLSNNPVSPYYCPSCLDPGTTHLLCQGSTLQMTPLFNTYTSTSTYTYIHT